MPDINANEPTAEEVEGALLEETARKQELDPEPVSNSDPLSEHAGKRSKHT